MVVERIVANFSENTKSATTATALLTLAAIAAVVLPIMYFVGRYSGAIQHFMKAPVGHNMGRNWMWVVGGGAVTVALGTGFAIYSFRKAPDTEPVRTLKTEEDVEAAKAGLGAGWMPELSEDGFRVNFRNINTGQVTEARPKGPAIGAPESLDSPRQKLVLEDRPLLEGWMIVRASDGTPLFQNSITKATLRIDCAHPPYADLLAPLVQEHEEAHSEDSPLTSLLPSPAQAEEPALLPGWRRVVDPLYSAEPFYISSDGLSTRWDPPLASPPPSSALPAYPAPSPQANGPTHSEDAPFQASALPSAAQDEEPALLPGWSKVQRAGGDPFYWNDDTWENRSEPPFADSENSMELLAQGWIVITDGPTKKYINRKTHETRSLDNPPILAQG